MTKPQRCFVLWAILGAASPALLAQPDRITARIDSSQSVALSGRVPRQATAQNDAGAVAGNFPIPGMTLMLKPSAAQQADLNQLLLAQQDSTSLNYHQWLTPDQYATRFGVSNADLAKITAWLESQGFAVSYTARAHNFVAFSGTAQQVLKAFHTEIHSYQVKGETHWANATPPSIPAALSGLVSGINGLNNFRLKPRFRKAQPRVTLGGQPAVGPNDFATIYDVNALYSAGITGSGQKIVVVGQSEVLESDITTFRNTFGLGAANFEAVLVPGALGGGNPGYSEGDEEESDLDIEWSGAVAKNAEIIFVYAANGAWASAQYAVDQDLAPVLSMSYGSCEEYDLIDLPSSQATVQQANSEGITWLAAAGDYAAADCDELDNTDPAVAEGGLAVDAPGSIPEVTSMGGTEFNEGTGNYWVNGAAVSYIPEIVWNDTVEEGQLAGGGGGASVNFTQPPWQNGIAPNDGMRHVPDLSFPASNLHDSYYIYTSDPTAGAVRGVAEVGGTSCAAPSMAGIVALLNQHVASGGVGNINPTLYRLAQTQSSAFHTVTGNNIVPCANLSPNCQNVNPDTGIGSEGWTAGSGYNSASGWGSVDAYNFVEKWSTAAATQAVVVPSIDQNPVYETATNLWSFTLTLTEEAGFATTLTGLSINGTSFTQTQIAQLFGATAIPARGSISATYNLQGLSVSSGPVSVPFAFSGGSGSATWSNTMSVPFTGFQAATVITAISNAASYQQNVFAPGMLINVWGTGLANFAQPATIAPLPEYMAGSEAYVAFGADYANYANAPFLYVSPGQVNLQIPYEVPAGPAQVSIGTPYGPNDYYNFTVQEAAPGIFSYADTSSTSSPIGSGSARAGQEVAIYVTGVGAVTPNPGDGNTPDPSQATPVPQQAVSLTVGGVAVAQPFAFIGIPSWSVGVLQINFTIPNGVATGPQPLVVTVGGVSSLPANITITQ